jgi:hypothetical protein
MQSILKIYIYHLYLNVNQRYVVNDDDDQTIAFKEKI